MRSLTKALAPTLLAVATVVAVPLAVSYAQQQPPAPGAAPDQPPGPRGPRGDFTPPSPETMQRMLDGRLAAARAALRLSEAQLRLWAPIEELVKQGHADRMKRMQEWRERAGQRGAAPPPLPDRLDRMSQTMAERAARMKALADAMKPLYATLSDEQKAVIGPVLRQLAGPGGGMRGRHRGPRWAGPGGPVPQ
jgi:hypothetical protein